jgi:hypothetical protein
VRNIYTLKGMYVKIGWTPMPIQNIFNIYNIYNSNNNKHRKVYRLLNYKWREWRHNLLLKSLDLAELQVPPSRPKSIEGLSFEFELGRRMV